MLIYKLYSTITNVYISRDNLLLLPNAIEQVSNEYLATKNRPPLSHDVVNLIKTQVLSIKEIDHKIKTLVGNDIVLQIYYNYYVLKNHTFKLLLFQKSDLRILFLLSLVPIMQFLNNVHLVYQRSKMN